MNIEKEIKELRSFEDAYYNGTPKVTDMVYDHKRDNVLNYLRKHDPNHNYLTEVGFPVPENSQWEKFTHKTIMGSLNKVNNNPDFIKWAKKRGNDFFLAEKIDGCTVVAYYENGILQTLATRGDGLVGENITPNARYINNLLLRLPIPFTGILRGEAFLKTHIFEEHFSNMANPRNAVSGKIRDTKNPHLKRHINVLWFDLLSDDLEAETWEDKFDFIESLNIKTVRHFSGNPQQLWKIYNKYVNQIREKLDYWIDGLVVRINNLEDHDAQGVVDKRPKGSVALKFPVTGVKTILKNIEYNRGLSGTITPVALIEPVIIDGTTVSRASLHGKDWISNMDLCIGDLVEVAKAGDIIPQITRKISSTKNSKPIIFPTKCPECHKKLNQVGAYSRCENKLCNGAKYGAIKKWLEKLDIKGIGPAILQNLINEVEDIVQLYESDISVFIKAANYSDKVGKKVFKTLHSSKDIPLGVFLSALHIDSLGSTNGQRIADHFNDINKILNASEEEFEQIPGIATNAQKIVKGLREKKSLIQKLQTLVNIQTQTKGVFSGKSFCITGKLKNGKKRSEIENWIKSLGGVVKGVDKDLTYLVTNTPNSGSSKNKKADKYNVKKITEDELYILAGEENIENEKIRVSVEATVIDSLFDTKEEHWIDLIQKQDYFEIENTSLLEIGDFGFFKWDNDIVNIDYLADSMGVSKSLRWENKVFTTKRFNSNDLSKIKEFLSKVTFCNCE